VNQDLLRDAGLVRSLKKPLKILGTGELSAALFVVADAFTKSAQEKIEGAGGSVNVLEPTSRKTPAIGVGATADAGTAEPTAAAEAAPTEQGLTDAAETDATTEPPADRGEA
jgi:hypothetical protein